VLTLHTIPCAEWCLLRRVDHPIAAVKGVGLLECLVLGVFVRPKIWALYHPDGDIPTIQAPEGWQHGASASLGYGSIDTVSSTREPRSVRFDGRILWATRIGPRHFDHHGRNIDLPPSRWFRQRTDDLHRRTKDRMAQSHPGCT
jgi:hypothetical protein